MFDYSHKHQFRSIRNLSLVIVFFRRIAVLLVYLSTLASLDAQYVTIANSNTREGIKDVFLHDLDGDGYSLTDHSGKTDLSHFPSSADIVVSHLGFVSDTMAYRALVSQDTVFLIPLEQALEEVVIAASRWRQSIAHTPKQLSIIRPKEVFFQNPQNAADMLALSGQVFVQKSQQGGGSPMIRGFATNRLLLAVDGVRMNTAIFRSGNIQNVISLDPYAIQRTEVLLGPSSVMYGSDAIGGVMSFQTLNPTLSKTDSLRLSGKAVLRYASANDEITGHVDMSLGHKKWGMTTSISRYDYGHLRQGKYGPQEYVKGYYVDREYRRDLVIPQGDTLLQIPTAYDQINIMQKVRFVPTGAWDLTYGYHYSVTSPFGRYDRHNRIRNEYPRYGQWDYGPQRWQMHHFKVLHKGGLWYDLVSWNVAIQKHEESRISRNWGSIIKRTQAEQVKATTVNLDMNKSIKSLKFNYGAEYVYNDVRSKGRRTDISNQISYASNARYPDARWESLAAYTYLEYPLGKSDALTAGLRYNHFWMKANFLNNLPYFPLPFKEARLNSGALTGSLGAVLRPRESLVLKANVGTAFRAPNVDDMGKVFDSEPGAVTIPNPDLRAEYAYNADAQASYLFNKDIKASATVYYSFLDDAMARQDFRIANQDSILYEGVMSKVQAIQNISHVTVYGLHFGLDIKLLSGLRLISDFNIQKGIENVVGDIYPSRHAAPIFGVTRLIYGRKNFKLEINTTYQGARSHEKLARQERGKTEIYALDSNGKTYAPAWYTLNVKSRYSLSKNIDFNIGIENITNQRYRPYSSGVSGAGINLVGSVLVRY